jgi:hypothetical protein
MTTGYTISAERTSANLSIASASRNEWFLDEKPVSKPMFRQRLLRPVPAWVFSGSGGDWQPAGCLHSPRPGQGPGDCDPVGTLTIPPIQKSHPDHRPLEGPFERSHTVTNLLPPPETTILDGTYTKVDPIGATPSLRTLPGLSEKVASELNLIRASPYLSSHHQLAHRLILFR